jgi:alpha-glucosidase (family GH31 glycosyl hydrolase)
MPYLYSLYRRTAERGEPILRPTFFDFPEVSVVRVFETTGEAK